MKPSEIKDAIADKGFTLSMVADALGVNLATVSGVVCGHTQSRRIAEAICKIIEQPLNVVFPEAKAYSNPRVLRGEDRKQGVAQLQQLLAS
ncbi:transcriptional regulator [Pseudoalteromonas maricaloris]|uniref:transcriptional regulator n=1 Tax=Pseudoalteromonas maricaloris TaxID=184924 RepID=UPI00029A6B87|nr:transcriptional regulator [Pseudoalteromonas flavipulchra]